MNRFQQRFGKRHVLLPVIHVINYDQALRNTCLAHELGADGVFLINHEIDGDRPVSSRQLLEFQERLAITIPDWWIGVNCLDLTASEQFLAVGDKVHGIWSDNAHIDDADLALAKAKNVDNSRAKYSGLYFGGVAFKYQAPVADAAVTARRAAAHMDVVTTSGSGTGNAASVEKIKRMKEAIGTFPLAVASGITPENVAAYLPYVDCFLVATGISKSFTELNSDLLRQLIANIAKA